MIRLPNSILCFFIKKNWIDFISCARAGLVGNIGKIIFFNFPTLSWQPNRITTSRTIKKKLKQNNMIRLVPVRIESGRGNKAFLGILSSGRQLQTRASRCLE